MKTQSLESIPREIGRAGNVHSVPNGHDVQKGSFFETQGDVRVTTKPAAPPAAD
jgi:hypothetical protein